VELRLCVAHNTALAALTTEEAGDCSPHQGGSVRDGTSSGWQQYVCQAVHAARCCCLLDGGDGIVGDGDGGAAGRVCLLRLQCICLLASSGEPPPAGDADTCLRYPGRPAMRAWLAALRVQRARACLRAGGAATAAAEWAGKALELAPGTLAAAPPRMLRAAATAAAMLATFEVIGHPGSTSPPSSPLPFLLFKHAHANALPTAACRPLASRCCGGPVW